MPVVVGFGIGYLALGAFLAAAILTAQLMANFLSNTGGAWDNAKKYIEEGHYGGKGSDSFKAAVIGDTVGDPFKDTAGPALNPLMKVMNLVSLLILPAVITTQHDTAERYAVAGVALLVILGGIAFSKRKVASLSGPTGTISGPAVGSPAVGPEAVAGPEVVAASAAPAEAASASRPPLQSRGKG
jgi:K(+)-stimulated pyrophosphate-energized sodium pump